MAFRCDIGMLRPARRRADGSVVVDAFITRAGIFTYMNPDGTLRRELRDPKDVFDAASMRSFDMLTVTNTHPYQMVTAENARQFMVGASSKVERDDDHLRTELMVADKQTVGEMDDGSKAQVSCGYTCDYDPTPGVHPVWGRYDGRQTNIRGNHIALVSHARAGETARVRMDEHLSVMVTGSGSPHAPPMNAPAPRAKEIQMPTGKDNKTITIEAATAELAKETQRADAAIAEVAELKKSVTEQTARADAAEGALAVAREKIEELQCSAITQEKFDAQVAKVADLEKQLAAEKLRADTAEDPKRRSLEVQERARVEAAVRRVIGEDYKCDGLDNKALMTEVVKKLGKAPAPEESEASIRARFDERIGNFDASEAAIARVRAAANASGQLQRVDSVDDVKRRAEEKRRSAWQSGQDAK